MILKLNQTFAGLSHVVCAAIAPAPLASRRDFKSRVLWLGWCPGFLFLKPAEYLMAAKRPERRGECSKPAPARLPHIQ